MATPEAWGGGLTTLWALTIPVQKKQFDVSKLNEQNFL
jgi:hypothetical protein